MQNLLGYVDNVERIRDGFYGESLAVSDIGGSFVGINDNIIKLLCLIQNEKNNNDRLDRRIVKIELFCLCKHLECVHLFVINRLNITTEESVTGSIKNEYATFQLSKKGILLNTIRYCDNSILFLLAWKVDPHSSLNSVKQDVINRILHTNFQVEMIQAARIKD